MRGGSMITLTREEAQQVLDALENLASMAGAAWTTDNPIETLRARLAQPEPEPVAWIHRFIEHGISIGKKPVDLDKNPDRWMPVYKDPTPCQTCEALARIVMMDQASHDTRLQRERVKFPTMLRKMWSGSEVQAWLDETVNKENKR